ncbi:hypothetical protein [Methylobacterium sp. WL19]|uniref:hypothetical protein n=1 Tax=Methylobacterium sp. WL19 TaxID=2603896 RepID=UPI0011C859DF|nr:hypothetical protein [Methylobacterium sp. WL19]TXN33913.1 hypothetical protein FV220_00245 [Methylobacterium sp. WL19]
MPAKPVHAREVIVRRGYSADTPEERMTNVEILDIVDRCLRVREAGASRAKRFEVGFVKKIITPGGTFIAGRYDTWDKQASEIEAFLTLLRG